MTDSECYSDGASMVNRLLETLSSPHRRELIHHFESSSQADTASLDAVVSYVAGRIPSTSPADVEMALHHTHLPKLEQRGWIDYDPREGVVRYHGKDDAEPVLSGLAAVFSG